jgi:hypothetical protein
LPTSSVCRRNRTGVVVSELKDGSIAAQLGFEPKDIIVSVNGADVKTTKELAEMANEGSELLARRDRARRPAHPTVLPMSNDLFAPRIPQGGRQPAAACRSASTADDSQTSPVRIT